MPQIFLVFRCYKCLVFQVHQAKKSNKFQCKLCGEKQSIKRNYGIGTAKDCRMHVQKLNGIRGEIDELKETNTRDEDTSDDCDEADIDDTKVQYRKQKKNKWSDFVNDTEETRETSAQDSMYLNNTEVVLEVPKKKEIDELSKKTIQNTVRNLATIKHVNNTKQPLKEKKECAFLPMINEKNNKTPDADKKRKFVCPKISSNSKWAQFIEDEDCLENIGNDKINRSDDEPNTTNIPDKKDLGKSQELFALYNDSDLDNILDI